MTDGSSIPAGAKPLSHQVAGHVHTSSRPGFLESGDGYILKPLQNAPRGPRELSFYKLLFESPDPPDHIRQLRQLVPQYHRTLQHADVTYIQLDDISRQFKHPCIADLKMGAITYDPDATEDKKRRELSKYPYLQNVCFQIRGMRIYNQASGDYDVYEKTYLRSFNEEEVLSKGFMKFFTQEGRVCVEVVRQVLGRLYQFRAWFESQKQFSFYASSLLVVYEADPPVPGAAAESHTEMQNCNSTTRSAGDTGRICHKGPTLVDNSGHTADVTTAVARADVRLIDFAHVFPLTTDRDENFLSGLTSLISYLERLISIAESR